MLNSWSPNGDLVFLEASPTPGIWTLPLESEGEAKTLVKQGFYPDYSPDGKWFAYISFEKGLSQVFVSPVNDPEVKFLVSGKEGGSQPVWSLDGTEIFYRSANKMMVVAIGSQPTFESGTPKVLFEGSYLYSPTNPQYQYYDISLDGQRFLMIKPEINQTPINVVRLLH